MQTSQRMVVACTNAQGEPDFFFIKVQATQEQVDNGDEVCASIRCAKDEGYEGPMVVFNCEIDSAGMAIVEHFTWNTASIVNA